MEEEVVEVEGEEPDAQVEARRILSLANGELYKAFDMVERQFHVLVLRTQVLLSLCGVVVMVTGFSGRAVAETSHLARLSITCGIFLVLLSAAIAVGGVLRLKWLTRKLTDEPTESLVRAITHRDRKARFLAAALVVFIVGFACYCLAIAQLLMAARPPGP